jgi:hypothetical protein
MSQYKAPDFQVIFPDIWSAIPPQDVVSQRDGKTIKRVSIGQVASNGDAEGLQVTNLLVPLDPDATKNLDALGTTVLSSLRSGVKEDATVVSSGADTMDGEKALRIELKGTGLDEVDPTTGQTFAGKGQHYLAYCCWHKGRAYILVISTLETRWEQLGTLFAAMAKEWRFNDGAAPTVCSSVAPAASPDAAATADAGASAEAGASPAAAPTPRVVYAICAPEATGAASPQPSAAASPLPSPSPSK